MGSVWLVLGLAVGLVLGLWVIMGGDCWQTSHSEIYGDPVGMPDGLTCGPKDYVFLALWSIAFMALIVNLMSIALEKINPEEE